MEVIFNAHDVKVVILHMKAVQLMDLTGAQTLFAIRDQLDRKGIRLVLAELQAQPFEILEKSGLLEKIGEQNVFSAFREAILCVNADLLKTNCHGCADALKPPDEHTLRGPRDCLLRRSIVLNTDKIANTLMEYMHSEIAKPPPEDSGIDLNRLISIKTASDIPPALIRTPIEGLLRAQNLYDVGFDISASPSLIIGMCIDHRKQINIPKNGAYIVRSPGANMKGQEYSIALALSAGITYMALIVHNKCLMTNPFVQQKQFEEALIQKHGWTKEQLQEAYDHFTERKIGDPTSFAIAEAQRLQNLFKGLTVVPMLYDVFDDRLFVIKTEALEKAYSQVSILIENNN